MNSMMRGLTQKQANKLTKLNMLNQVIQQQDGMIKYLEEQLKIERVKNAAINSTEGESLPSLSDNLDDDSKAVEEPRGELRGQGSDGKN
jgi:hypothetical protein